MKIFARAPRWISNSEVIDWISVRPVAMNVATGWALALTICTPAELVLVREPSQLCHHKSASSKHYFRLCCTAHVPILEKRR